ncbi:vitamin K epoxide reductase family protein [Streptomyces sp. RKND-216]|uniref:vitamin K epoxide reductase family protein n=1 Tax=Streptomyces sp. RKND-216 TaxID=2562581 RepID=UPI00109DAA0C|nr:vitamin K epoxide reductase family protein [Streptomyces sp. RKND-216]THA27332.1 vitamin K epoxide reductase family protein [Streptomyces sp. RKND-216]
MTTTASPDHARTSTDEPPEGAVGARRGFSWLLIVTGLMGLLAAVVITIDKTKILEAKALGETYTPGCSLNPILSCGNIMESAQASAFGFSNPLIGLVAYPVVIAIGVTLLTGTTFPRWYWLTFNAGCLFGVGFVTWLQYHSLYTIGALCLWCCLAWVATIFLFWYVTSHTLTRGLLPAPAGVRNFVEEFPWVLPVMHTGVIGMLILTQWWSFWTG